MEWQSFFTLQLYKAFNEIDGHNYVNYRYADIAHLSFRALQLCKAEKNYAFSYAQERER